MAFAHPARLRQVTLSVKHRDHKRIRETVTHERRHRRADPGFIVVEWLTLTDKVNELLLLIEKHLQRTLYG